MRVHHINCGTLCPLGRRMMNGEGGILERGRLVTHCLILELDDRLVLVDTGFGQEDVGDPGRSLPGPLWQAINQAQLDEDETAIVHLRRRGLDPTDVRDIVLTHLDFDHAGGIADFPNAHVHVLSSEYEEATHPSRWISHERYADRQWLHGPKWQLHAPDGESWFGFQRVRPIFGESILLIPLPGHSRGHAGVAMLQDGRWLLHAGDAIFRVEELERPVRKAPLGIRAYQNVFQHDREIRLENVSRLRQLVAQHDEEVRVFCSHDPADFTLFETPARAAYMA